MRRATLFFVVAFGYFESFDSIGMFARYETRQVPIERLFTNLQARLAQDTNDFALTYDLARLHSLAYSTNLVTMNVRTNDERPVFYQPGSDPVVPERVYAAQSSAAQVEALRHLTNSILLYERTIFLLKKPTNEFKGYEISSKTYFVAPVSLGYGWCLDQAGRRDEALTAYRNALTIAWKKEVTEDFNFKAWALANDKVAPSQNPLRPVPGQGFIGPGLCLSEEVIGYLLKLLDPAKDAKEVAEMHERRKILQSPTYRRRYTPILVPLTPAAELDDLVDPHARVIFDLDGTGIPREWGWVNDKAAWLVFDADGTGQITSALQMFGNVTFLIFWRDGYEALRSLDDDHDGELGGPELQGMALWEDRNCNGISEPGEVSPVAEWGITTISCGSETNSDGVRWSPSGVTLANGETRPTYDWVAPSPAQETLTHAVAENEAGFDFD